MAGLILDHLLRWLSSASIFGEWLNIVCITLTIADCRCNGEWNDSKVTERPVDESMISLCNTIRSTEILAYVATSNLLTLLSTVLK